MADILEYRSACRINGAVLLGDNENHDQIDSTRHWQELQACRNELQTYVDTAFDAAADQKINEMALAPVFVVQAPTGIGKTHARRNAYLNYRRDVALGGGALDLVPTTNLAVEVTGKLNEDVEIAKVFRGRGAVNPDAMLDDEGKPSRMCLKSDSVALLNQAGQSVRTNFCNKCEFGPYGKIGGCAYLAQAIDEKEITVAAHNYLAVGNISGLPKNPHILSIDEDFSSHQIVPARRAPVQGRLRKYDGPHMSFREVTRQPDPCWILDDDGRSTGFTDETDTARLKRLREKLHEALSGCLGGYLRKDALLAAGIDEEAAEEARRLEHRSMPVPTDLPRLSAGELKATLGKYNAPHDDRQMIWRAVLDLLRDTDKSATGLYVTRGRDLLCRHVRGIAGNFDRSVILYTDATPPPQFIQEAIFNARGERPIIREQIDVLPSFQHVTAVLGAPVSRSKLARDGGTMKRRLRDQARSIRADIRRNNNDPKKVLVITHKPCVEDLQRALGDDVVVKHFGGLAGLNEYEDFQAAYLVGEPRARTDTAISVVEAVTGEVIEEEFSTTNYLFKDISGQTHKNENVSQSHPNEYVNEYFNWQIAKELLQALGRLRGLNRTHEDPCRIVILADSPLPGVQYHEVKRWTDWCVFQQDAVLEAGILPASASLISKTHSEHFKREGVSGKRFWDRYKPTLISEAERRGWTAVQFRDTENSTARWMSGYVDPDLLANQETLTDMLASVGLEFRPDPDAILIGADFGGMALFHKRDNQDTSPYIYIREKSCASGSAPIRNERHETVDQCIAEFGFIPASNKTHASALAPHIWSDREEASRPISTVNWQEPEAGEVVVAYKWKPADGKRAQKGKAIVRADNHEQAVQILLSAMPGAEILL